MNHNRRISTMTSEKLAELSIFYGAVQKNKELTQLVDLLKQKPKLNNVLEIGSASGGTFWLWCQLASSTAQLTSIDLPLGRFNNGRTYNEKLLLGYKKPNQTVSLIRKNSHSPKTESKLCEVLNEKELDLLFIDGDHTYEGVKDDYNRYSKYVKNGGLIVLHDIAHHDQVKDCQVDKFWNELKQQHSVVEIIDPEYDDRGWGSWGGLGVLVK